MAKYRGPVCRLCRREELKLFLKGDRCYTEKCSFDRRPNQAPGQHGDKRPRFSEYRAQLREKQKLRRIYGVLENQFKLTFNRAERIKGITGDNLIEFMESRLDNTVYRAGFSNSRAEGRQLIRHGHFVVNGKKVNIPSFRIKQGDTIEVRSKSKNIERLKQAVEAVDRRGIPEWLELDKKSFKANVKRNPMRSDVTLPINEQLVVELYSK